MKKRFLFLLAFGLGSSTLFAQQAEPVDSARLQLDSIFANLDKSQIPTAYLEEYGLSFSPLANYNGTLTDSTLTDLATFRQLYASLFTSRIHGSNPLPTLATVNQRLTAAQSALDSVSPNPPIPLLLLWGTYNTIRPDAESANLLRLTNGQLFDVPGRSQSPYLTRPLFAASPGRSYVESGQVSLVFKRELSLSNSPEVVTGLQINFGDGRGFLSTFWNTPLTAVYTTSGKKRIQVRVIYDGPMVLLSQFDIEVRLPQATPQARYGGPFLQIPFEPEAGVHSGGNVFIDYGANHTQLVKPLIIAEGYDISAVAPDFQDNISINNFLWQITNQPDVYNFRDALDNTAGYDLVYIDYNDGTDDIRRNAALFQQVIQWVNTNRAGLEPNVVLGISMGGLVARYGLAQLVKAGQDPQTRLLITHDSPHRGANTPLGVQALIRQLDFTRFFGLISSVDQEPAIGIANLVLDRPATHQLLMVRYPTTMLDRLTTGVTYNTFLDGEYRSMVTFPAGGPQPAYRFIATSQGSECGSTLGTIAPAEQLLSFFIGGRVKTSAWVNALPNQQRAEIMKLRIWKDVYVLGRKVREVNLNRGSFTAPPLPAWDSAPGGTQDLAAVGLDPQRFGADELVLGGQFCFVPTFSALDIDGVVETPLVYSAYNGSQPGNSRAATFITQEPRQVQGQTVSNQTHTFFTARQSQWLFGQMQNTTVLVTNCSVACPAPPLSITSTPVSTDCVGADRLAVPDQGSGAQYQWTVGPKLEITTGLGTPTIQVRPSALADGSSANVAVTVTLPGGCPQAVTPLALPVSQGIRGQNYLLDGVPTSLTNLLTVCVNTVITLSGDIVGPATQVRWTTSEGDLTYESVLAELAGGIKRTTASLIVSRPLPSQNEPPATDLGVVRLEAYGCGGWTELARWQVIVIDDRPLLGLNVYPNPANEDLTVAITSLPIGDGVPSRCLYPFGGQAAPEAFASKAGSREVAFSQGVVNGSQPVGVSATSEVVLVREVRLVNTYQRIVAQGQTMDGTLHMSTRHLPPGFYYVETTLDTHIQRERVFIAH